jgi:hypothetical protein
LRNLVSNSPNPKLREIFANLLLRVLLSLDVIFRFTKTICMT